MNQQLFGPAMEAELAYRRERAALAYGRPLLGGRAWRAVLRRVRQSLRVRETISAVVAEPSAPPVRRPHHRAPHRPVSGAGGTMAG
ncbi:hypothetical protein GCM10023216_28320 [Isoptericola chiayiensis]|uniref:Uncharacterized protein n=1 Tax=Isoptericola chiayiensis TaxID=579446 RepID=A0ABP8YPW4_9MICO|nr:hypothetical protein [Isoptericola chiayiensis]NOW02247.1 hypothetical protein [Isoptericola chiayiensis]